MQAGKRLLGPYYTSPHLLSPPTRDLSCVFETYSVHLSGYAVYSMLKTVRLYIDSLVQLYPLPSPSLLDFFAVFINCARIFIWVYHKCCISDFLNVKAPPPRFCLMKFEEIDNLEDGHERKKKVQMFKEITVLLERERERD